MRWDLGTYRCLECVEGVRIPVVYGGPSRGDQLWNTQAWQDHINKPKSLVALGDSDT